MTEEINATGDLAKAHTITTNDIKFAVIMLKNNLLYMGDNDYDPR